MKTYDAVMAIAKDSYIRRRRPVDYRRVCRALDALGLSEFEKGEVLVVMEYHQTPDEPYQWTQDGRG